MYGSRCSKHIESGSWDPLGFLEKAHPLQSVAQSSSWSWYGSCNQNTIVAMKFKNWTYYIQNKRITKSDTLYPFNKIWSNEIFARDIRRFFERDQTNQKRKSNVLDAKLPFERTHTQSAPLFIHTEAIVCTGDDSRISQFLFQ